MREIEVSVIREAVAKAVIEMNIRAEKALLEKMKRAAEAETSERAKRLLEILIENAKIAEKEKLPLCQDTGFVTVFLEIGQEVHLIGGSVIQAIQDGVRDGYEQGYLRKSIVSDPVDKRINTKDNTPAVIYTELFEGEQVRLRICCKGQGSENCSKVFMLKPSEGREGIKQAVLETVKAAGPNACPPMIVGVGIGGSFDSCAVLSKKALLQTKANPTEFYSRLEAELLEEINQLNIGPQGLKGKTTALAVHILEAPCHIAGMPVAINLCCHVSRHKEISL